MNARDVTLAPETVHSPHDARHFMRLKPVAGRVRIVRDGTVLAESADALRLLEVGFDFYDPILYLPRADVTEALAPSEKSTHCPIKGDTTYYDLVDASGAVVQPAIAWQYAAPIAGAEALADRIAFDPSQVTVEERPA